MSKYPADRLLRHNVLTILHDTCPYLNTTELDPQSHGAIFSSSFDDLWYVSEIGQHMGDVLNSRIQHLVSAAEGPNGPKYQ